MVVRRMGTIKLLASFVILYACATCVISGGGSTECRVGQLDPESFRECGNRGYVMQCNATGLDQIPRGYPKPENETLFPPPLCLLNLSYNNFHIVGNQSFVNVENLNSTDVLWLYLDYSNISYIESHAFDNLTNLQYLNLSGNHLNYLDSFGPGVFKPLINLLNINLKENNFKTFSEIGKELSCLTSVKGLFIDLCDKCVFGKEFKHMSNLETLSLAGRSKGACNSTTVSNDTFSNVTMVQKIYMSSCNIETIEADVFSNFTNLTWLDISYNERLNFTGMNKALYGLRNSSTLQMLNVNRINPLYGLGIKLELSHIENLKTLQALEILHMDLNKIEVFEEDIFKTFQLPKPLQELTLSGNRLTYGHYVKYLNRVDGIRKIDISRQHLNFDPFFHEHYENQATHELAVHQENSKPESECPNYCDVCLSNSLHHVQWRQSFVYFKIDRPMYICNATSLAHLDLSFNLILKWNFNVSGLENMTHLDISENYCDEISPYFLERFFALKHLNISGNMLGPAFDPALNPNASETFKQQHNLTKLDMSANKIVQLPNDIFKHLKKIEYLNLSGNVIGDWNYTLVSPHLRGLDLSGNKLYTLPESLTTYLDSLLDDEGENINNVTVRLSKNPLECTCGYLPFLKWMYKSEIHVTFSKEDGCRLNGETFPFYCTEHLGDLIRLLETDICVHKKDESWVIWAVGSGCTIIAVIISVVVCLLIHKNRWKLRHMYYSRNRRYRHEGFERLFENDAFVSYAKNSASFIKNQMVPVMEEQHGLHLWVADKSSQPGVSVAENICHGIYNSRKCVLLVNREYLNDAWCDYEMNMAHMESIETNRKMIIVVLIGNIPMNHLPISLLRLLRQERSLEFPEHEHDLSTFWMNLIDEINS